jgi:hypothetical protein
MKVFRACQVEAAYEAGCGEKAASSLRFAPASNEDL